MPRITYGLISVDDGWRARVTVTDRTTTEHEVRITRAEHERYGGGDVGDLVRRSFEFLLAREANTSILPEFSLSTIERYSRIARSRSASRTA
ncbi:MAG TPA: hypothetical protein VI814_08050, partial [Candidatus Limnocylindria bacterium]